MRFKGQKTSEDLYVYGSLIEEGEKSYIQPAYSKDKHQVHKNTIGQFTGFLDVNETEIYTKDIIFDGEDYGKITFENGMYLVYYHSNYKVPLTRRTAKLIEVSTLC